MKFVILSFAPAFLFAQGGTGLEHTPASKKDTDSTFVYSLPYEEGKSHFLVQGYNSIMSHRNEFALDFKMRRGTKVCAMRGGVVEEVKENSNKRGLRKKFFNDANYVLVKHDDDSYGWYFHLKQEGVLVQPGENIQAGQVIALSGNTGYSAFPHLHVEVVKHSVAHYIQVPTRFRCKKRIRYLRSWRFYRNPQTNQLVKINL